MASEKPVDETVKMGDTEPAASGAGLRAPSLALGTGAPSSDSRDQRSALDYPTLTSVNIDHYVQGEEIARGGMGRIRVARDRRLGRELAVKEIVLHDADSTLRFEREARITARLQHPSIVDVHEAGVWSTGELFFAMNLIRGRSFDEVVDEAKTLEQRLALLPHVLAVADAMAYAHGEGVIHRDLKPKNILIGSFGETVVIDWGLAKELRDPTKVTGGSTGSRLGDAEATAFGEVMGTPAYMPPEQAAGDPVDERADVYALGAILDHLLSGKAPFAGDASHDVLEAVKRGPPVPLSERQPGVPPDLQAIVERAMARDRAVRYRTARQLAEDLRRYQTGQLVGAHAYSLSQLLRRWLRRYRATVMVAGAAMVLLLVVGVVALTRVIRAEELASQQRLRAEQQRQLAQDNRAEAEKLLDFMLVDLRDSLRPLGKLDLLEPVASKAVDYYNRQPEQLTTPELVRRALARRNLADVLFAQGHSERALPEYQASLASSLTLAATSRGDPDRWGEVATSYGKLGNLQLEIGKTDEAVAAFTRALEITKGLAEQDPTNARRQRESLVSHELVGAALYHTADAAGALGHYRAAQVIARKLAAQDPANTQGQIDLAVSHNNVGDVLRVLGDAQALTEYRAAQSIAQLLVNRDPTNVDRQRAVALSHSNIGSWLLRQGDLESALREFRSALNINQKLVDRDPTNANWQQSLARVLAKIGSVLQAKGDLTGALEKFREFHVVATNLAASDPTNIQRQSQLESALEHIGDVLLARGDVTGALVQHEASAAISERLAKLDAKNADRKRRLLVSHIKVGDVMLRLKEGSRAIARYQAAKTIAEMLVTIDSANTSRRRDLLVSLHSLGDAFLANGDSAAALVEYRASFAITQVLASDPQTVGILLPTDLPESHAKIAAALAARGDRKASLAEYEQAVAHAERLSAIHPQVQALRVLAAKLRREIAKLRRS